MTLLRIFRGNAEILSECVCFKFSNYKENFKTAYLKVLKT